LDSLLEYADSRRYAERNRVIVLLSFKAGMRACEISGLKWEIVLGSDGAVSDKIMLAQGITKGGRGRTIPMHGNCGTLCSSCINLKASRLRATFSNRSGKADSKRKAS
jgi:integrase